MIALLEHKALDYGSFQRPANAQETIKVIASIQIRGGLAE